MLERYAPFKGNVPLVLKNGSFFVHVDFANHEQDASDTDRDNDDYGNMIPALYTDKTFFGKDCQGFLDYCAKYSFRCIDILKPKFHFNFPYFESEGHLIESEVYLDYHHWKLKTSAVASSGCNGFYSGGYGLLGMGFDGESLINYLKAQPTFTVHIDKSMKSGMLSFQEDFTKAKSIVPAAKITSDSNWHIKGIKSFTVDRITRHVDLRVIFDLGSDAIGFPVGVYEQVLASIQQYKSMGKCVMGSDFMPTCQFSGDIRKLPTIFLNHDDQKIAIPPEVYVVQTQTSFFYSSSVLLRLKALSSDPKKGSYVTSSYANCVVLGYPMMSYYYTVFDGGKKNIDPKFNVKPSVILYYSKDIENSDRFFFYIVGTGLLGFIVISLVYYCYKKHRKIMMGIDEEKRALLVVSGKRARRRFR